MTRLGLALARRELPMPALRDRLRQAQERGIEAHRAAAEASRAAERGRGAVEAARAALAAQAGVDGAVAGHRADAIRAGDSRSTALPPELALARLQQAAAREALSDAEGAAAILDGEHADAQQAVEKAAAELRGLVDDVMQAEAGELLGRMREAEIESGRLRLALLGLVSNRPISAPPLAFNLQAFGRDTIHLSAIAAAERAGHRPAPEVWQRLRAALATNSTATLDEGRPDAPFLDQ